MRIVINDHLGRAPQVQLSRALAARGHNVLHLYASSVQTWKADLQRHADDPDGFLVEGLSGSFKATSFLGLRWNERRFGRVVSRRIQQFRPDVVMACHNPLDVQRCVQSLCRRAKIPFVYWLQRFCALELDRALDDHHAVFDALVGAYYHSLERTLLQRSAAIVVPSDDLLGILATDWNVYERQSMVVHNWAPLHGVIPGPKNNAWSRTTGLSEKKVVMYTGTLGPMEDPMLFVGLADRLRDRSDIQFVVVSEGTGAELLKHHALSKNLENLVVLPFQPYDVYSEVLAAADVLLASVEENASALFNPSKVPSYFCAGRPIVLAAPWQNLAARSVQESGGGRVVAPGNAEQFAAAVLAFIDDVGLQRQAGTEARKYAERMFEIAPITARFERLFERLTSGPPRRHRS